MAERVAAGHQEPSRLRSGRGGCQGQPSNDRDAAQSSLTNATTGIDQLDLL